MRGEKRGWIRRVPILLVMLAATANAQRPPEPAQPQITGRVVDETGKPIAGAAVGAFAARDFVDTAKLLAKPQAVTAADGTYALAGNAAFASGVLVLVAEGRQACALSLPYPTASHGGSMGETLLVPGAKLIGRVRDETGAPLGGVRIRVDSSIVDYLRYQVRLLAGAVSNQQGIFVVPGVARSGLRLCAEADGFLSESRLVAQQTPIDLSLQKVGMVRGRVVDTKGDPVAGVAVYGVTVETRDAHETVLSDANGEFVLTVPTRSRYRLYGSDRSSPLRSFDSGILHGAADDVVLKQWQAADARSITVNVVDAVTGMRVREFRLAHDFLAPTNLQLALFGLYLDGRDYVGEAQFEVAPRRDEPLIAMVDAPGHGFEVVAVPDQLDTPLQVALGPEAVLTGRVTDAETGLPMAGVRVRALPKGNSGASSARSEDAWPATDVQGRYRIGKLRAGKYGVQAHARDRVASAVAPATLPSGGAVEVDLVVPKERWLELDLQGSIPGGPSRLLAVGSNTLHGAWPAGFEHSIPWPAPIPITAAGLCRLGPFGPGTFALQIFSPSRTRIGAGTDIALGKFDPSTGPVPVELPPLATTILRGRVELPKDACSERIAVLATPTSGQQQGSKSEPRPNVDGIDADGGFALDLPPGAYSLQLVDLLSGIVFHTEAQDIAIDGQTAPIALRPAIRWLTVACTPQQPGCEVVLQKFRVSLARPRSGALRAFLNGRGRNRMQEDGDVGFHIGGIEQRWMVPQGEIEIEAVQNFEVLRPHPDGYSETTVATAKVDIDKPEQRVTLKIPPPPSDEELLRRD